MDTLKCFVYKLRSVLGHTSEIFLNFAFMKIV
nr:MAG TPA: hypothetical protein [Caudoviricetes sp.]